MPSGIRPGSSWRDRLRGLMDPLVWLLLGGLGAWSALDGASLGQFMISRPLVTGTLAGLAVGDPRAGFLVGLLMEVAHLGSPPVGAVRLPEPGPAAVGAAVMAAGLGGGGGLAVGLALGLVLAQAGGATVTLKRRWHGRLVAGLEEGRLGPRALSRRLALALAVDAGRGGVLALAGAAAAVALARPLEGRWPLADEATVALLLVLLALPAAGLVRALPAGSGRLVFLMAGAGAGLLLGVWIHGEW